MNSGPSQLFFYLKETMYAKDCELNPLPKKISLVNDYDVLSLFSFIFSSAFYK